MPEENQSVDKSEIVGAQSTEQTFTAQPEAPKRRRGRPPKNASAQPLEQQTIAPGTDAPKQKRKYTKRRATLDPEQVATLAKQLQGIHMMIASAVQVPELQISEIESVTLAQSLQTVSNEYGLSLSGKTGATIQLLATAAIIYMPRMKYINEKFKPKKKTADVVVMENRAVNS